MSKLGEFLRKTREEKREEDPGFSLRKLAERIGIQPSYLSKLERGDEKSPSETVVRKLAKELDADTDVMLAMAGKISEDLSSIILKRPKLFSDLIRDLKKLPNHSILKLVREVRDGDW